MDNHTNTYTGVEVSSKYRDLLYQVALGRPVADVAHELDLSTKAAHEILNSPFMKDEMEMVKALVTAQVQELASGDAVNKKLEAACPGAADKMVEVMNGATPSLALQAAEKILRIKGYEKPQQMEHSFILPDRQVKLREDTLQMIASRQGLPSGEEEIVEAEVLKISSPTDEQEDSSDIPNKANQALLGGSSSFGGEDANEGKPVRNTGHEEVSSD